MMETSSPIPKEKLSESRTSPVSTKRTGRRVKEKRPMFDTLQVTRELRESGFAEPQAEAVVAAFGAIAGNVATKDDLRDFATKDDLRDFATKDDLKAIEEKMVTKDDLRHYATEAGLHKAVGELRQEMHAGFENMHRLILQVAMGTVTVNIAMVTAIFVIAKYLI